MKTISYAAPSKYVTSLCKQLREGGYAVARGKTTVVATDGTKEVLRACCSSRGDRWLVRADLSYFTKPDGSFAD